MGANLEDRVLTLIGDVMGLLDLDELSRGLIVALRRAVPSEWSALHELPANLPHTLSLTDPRIPSTMHAQFARYADQNPLVRHFMRTPEGRAVRFSDLVTIKELRALELHRTIYARLGIDYQIAFTLPSASGRLLGVALSRVGRDFDDEERDLLNLARPYLIQAYRNALEHTLMVRGVGRELNAADLQALGLTPRQAEVLRLVAMGHSDQDAASVLGIGLRTAQKHLERCYRLLGVENRSQAARIAWAATRS
jgi:DNA-binding CsgD family transcriptional regulator